MTSSFKSALKPFIPPVLVGLLRRGSAAVQVSGDYASWGGALAEAGGYDATEIIRRVAAATRKVVGGEAVYERDSVVFDHVEYSWPLLASLLQVALERGSLRVVDFGGSLGSTWRQNRTFLERLRVPITWGVVEQPHFVTLGKEEFSGGALAFHESITEAAREGVDAVLFPSSLCYVEDPARFLAEAAASGARYLIIDRLPVVAGERDRIALQKVFEPIYPASYPVRLFAEGRLLAHWLRDWRLIERWCCDLQPDVASSSHGFFLEKR